MIKKERHGGSVTNEGETRGAQYIVKEKSFGEDPRATTRCLVSNLPHPRFNKTMLRVW